MAERLRKQRAATLMVEVEDHALRLFDERGFDGVTVGDIASTAGISARTFYGYFPAKEDVLQVRIDQRAEALHRALEHAPKEEDPLHALRVALTDTIGGEDEERLRRWISVMVSKPRLARAVLGGTQQKIHPITVAFLTVRLGKNGDTILVHAYAAIASGVVQASLAHWYRNGGVLAQTLSEDLAVLDRFAGVTPLSG
jgi:AcrR family transcriptional regulator